MIKRGEKLVAADKPPFGPTMLAFVTQHKGGDRGGEMQPPKATQKCGETPPKGDDKCEEKQQREEQHDAFAMVSYAGSDAPQKRRRAEPDGGAKRKGRGPKAQMSEAKD